MPDGAILDILRADGAVNACFIVMTVPLGVGALILHRYDVQRLPIWIAFGWFVPDALLGYRDEHLRARSRACSLHIGAMMQTTTRRFDFGIAGAVTSCPLLSSCFRVFRDIETNNGAGDACCRRLTERNQCDKGWNYSSQHHAAPKRN
jgi:hypothetical protein